MPAYRRRSSEGSVFTNALHNRSEKVIASDFWLYETRKFSWNTVVLLLLHTSSFLLDIRVIINIPSHPFKQGWSKKRLSFEKNEMADSKIRLNLYGHQAVWPRLKKEIKMYIQCSFDKYVPTLKPVYQPNNEPYYY